MPVEAIENIVKDFKTNFKVSLSKVPRKKIIYHGITISTKLLVVAMPSSKIHENGHGWIDITKKQVDLFMRYQIRIIIFRLENSLSYYLNFNRLHTLLKKENMFFNKREGNHWKLYILFLENKIKVIGKGGGSLEVTPNNKSCIAELLN